MEDKVFLDFYKNYFLSYWEIKLRILKFQLENFDMIKNKSPSIQEIKDIYEYEKKLQNVLQFDLHFLKFQIIEALFSMIYALENADDEFLWFNLTFPKDKSERSFAVYDKISKLTDLHRVELYFNKEITRNGETIPLWKYLFFFNIDKSQNMEKIEISKDNILKILYHLAQIFSDRDDFNSYKHSLRCYSSSFNLSIIPHDNSESQFSFYAKYAINYLTLEKQNSDEHVKSVLKAFSPREDVYYIDKALELLTNIIKTRITFFEKLQEAPPYFFEKYEPKWSGDYTIQKISVSRLSKLQLLGNAYKLLKENDFNKALLFSEKVLQLDSKNYDAIFFIAECYFQKQEYEKARNYFKKYIINSLANNYQIALLRLGHCFNFLENYKKANEVLQKFLKKYEDLNDEITLSAMFLLAEVKLKLNDLNFKKKGKNRTHLLDSALKILNKTENSGFRHPELWFKLAFIYKILKRYETSKEIFEKLHKYHADNVDNIINLAEIYGIEEEFKKAEKLLNDGLKLNAKNFDIWISLINLKLKQEDIDGMFEACKSSFKICETDEERKFIYHYFGVYYFKNENYEKAIDNFEKALIIDANLINSSIGRINSLYKLKRFKEIIKLTEGLEFDQANFFKLKIRSYAYSELTKFTEASNLIDQLIQKFKNNLEFKADLLDTKGDIFKKQGIITQALKFYKKSLDITEKNFPFSHQTEKKILECEEILKRNL